MSDDCDSKDYRYFNADSRTFQVENQKKLSAFSMDWSGAERRESLPLFLLPDHGTTVNREPGLNDQNSSFSHVSMARVSTSIP